MLAQRENGNSWVAKSRADLLTSLACRIVTKFGHIVTAPPFAPRIYRWAGELSSAYQSVYPGENNFRWSQELISRIWSMQPLIRVTPYLWSPVNYFTWFPSEWFRHSAKWLSAERSYATTMNEIISERMPLEFGQEKVNSIVYLTYPEQQGEEIPFLYDVPESDMLAMRKRSNLQASTDLNPPSLPKRRNYPPNNLDIEGILPVGFYFDKPYPALPEIDIATFAKTIEPTSWLEMINRPESIITKWQPKLRIFLPLTLKASQGDDNTLNLKTPPEDIWSALEQGKQTELESPCLEKSLTQQQGLALPREHGVFDMPWVLMSPNFRHLLPEAEERDTVISPLSQSRKSNFYLDQGSSAGAHLLPSGVPTVESATVISQTSSAEHAFRQEMPLNLDWSSHHAEVLSLLLAPQTSASFWEGYPVGVVASGKEMSYGELAAHIVEPSANFGKPSRLATGLALAPLARPQGSSHTSLSSAVEMNAPPKEEQTEGATEADPDTLAGEVYKIIKHRLLVEKEQAQGMV